MHALGDFAAQPLVCGAIGAHAREHLDRIVHHVGIPMSSRAGDRWALATSSEAMLTSSGAGFTWARYVREGRPARSWRDAAHELGRAGLGVDDRGPVLHTDLFGVQDVFWRELGGTVCFSNRVWPLTTMGGEPLSTDMEGWGAALAYGGFVGAATGFVEIRRLLAGEVLRVGPDRVRRRRIFPDWLRDGDQEEVEVAELARVLARAVPGRFSRKRLMLTLSGGWDSRLIGMAVARNRARRPEAWTVSPDTGFDDDVALAEAVAAALRLRHRVVATSMESWVEHREETLNRVEHLTWLHTWLSPLAAEIRSAGLPVLDGLGGDVLLRNLFTGEKTRRGGRPARTRALFSTLGGGRLGAPGTLVPEVAEEWRESSLGTLRRTARPWAGHPSEAILTVLTLRTSRVIAASPMRLFAPEVPVILPFMTPAFVRAALAVPPTAKDGGGFYRALLQHVDPRVGSLPSTNDGPATQTSSRPRSQMTVAALTWLVAAVEDDDVVLGCLHPDLLRAIEARDIRSLHPNAVITLQWASAFAHWRRVHRRALQGSDVAARRGNARIG